MTGRMLRCLLLLGLMLAGMAETGRAAVPAGFSDALIADIGAPTAFAFTPDGRMLITTKGGTLHIWHGTLLATPALTFPAASICNNSERGLLGVAVDPDFATNRRIYLFYTFEKPDTSCVNRVSRFTFFSTPGQENQVDPTSELVLVDNMPSPNGNHNAGDVQIGKDGNLYISIGEGGIASAARNEHVLTGKILRITRDGDIPPTNPFQGAGTARCNVTGSTTPGNRCRETFAWGFRNPFRFAMDPNAVGTRFFINDVGQGAWEEIDEAQAGADYGWHCREGAHSTGLCSPTPPGMVDPIFEYPHFTAVPGTSASNCNSITGGAFVPNGLWPGFDGSYLFSDFICGWIFKLTQSGTWSASDFATSLGNGSAVHLRFGPWGTTQALYYTTFAGPQGGQVRRISRRVPRPAGPLDYHTVSPCRVVDTRSAFGMQGGPALAANATRTFQVAGLCGVPTTASAVALNVTVVSPATGGNLQIEQGDGPVTGTSVLNFTAGITRANNAIASLGTAGDVAVIAAIPSGTAHLVIDVVGYFE